MHALDRYHAPENAATKFLLQTSVMNYVENVGTVDRLLRVLLAITIVVSFFHHILGGAAGIVLLVFAVGLLVSAIFGYCPMYRLLGITTARFGAGH